MHATPWRWQWRSGLLLAELRPGDDWLDLGTGSGAFLALAPNGIGVDPDPESPGGELSDVPHAGVDVVWCSEVIEHVADPGEADRVAARVVELAVGVGGRLGHRRPPCARIVPAALPGAARANRRGGGVELVGEVAHGQQGAEDDGEGGGERVGLAVHRHPQRVRSQHDQEIAA